jgi:toxin-antitoxin system PIN domain toxin
MTTYLLDVNLLLALSDPMHVHHDPAHRWFARTGYLSWATCPITENGFVRIASHPRYPNRPGSVVAVLSLLRQLCSLEGHQFWAADSSIQDMLPQDLVVSHNQLTDIYLLGLAVHNQGRLATLDQRIPASLLKMGVEALELIDI